jgi:hypothetical protein
MTKSTMNFKATLAQIAYVLTYPALKVMNPRLSEKRLNGEFHVAVQGYLNGYTSSNVDLLLKQARLEAGSWDNKATLNDNNPFGMGIVTKRPTTQIGSRPAQDGTGRNYIGNYATIRSGVADRFLWDSYNKIDPKTGQYINAVIAGGYNQNTQYQFSWLNTKADGLSVAKIHMAMLAMLVAGFLVVQFLLKRTK